MSTSDSMTADSWCIGMRKVNYWAWNIQFDMWLRGESSLKATAAAVNGLQVSNNIDFFFFSRLFCCCCWGFFCLPFALWVCIKFERAAMLSLSRENKSNNVVSCWSFMFIAVLVDCWDWQCWSLINQFNIILCTAAFLRLEEMLHYQVTPPGGAAQFSNQVGKGIEEPHRWSRSLCDSHHE